MANITYGFFDSIDHDRVYNADEMSRYFQGLVGNGVFKGIGDQLNVRVSNNALLLDGGRAIIDCRWYNQEGTITLSVTAASARIDTVALKVDYLSRNISAVLVQGTELSPPVLTDSENIKYLPLAEVNVGSILSIRKNYIGTDVCPLLTDIGQKVDKIDGKGLSTNDFTDTNKTTLENLYKHSGTTDIRLNSLEASVNNGLPNKVDKIEGKGLSTNDFTDAYKTKLDGVAAGANKTIVDVSLNADSTNPVQNKAVASIWNSTQTMLTNVNNRVSALEASSGNGGVTGVKGGRESSYRTGNVSISCENIGASPAGHEHSNATTSSGGFMSSSDKNKLDGIAEGANKTIVDVSLNADSTNPVQNKAVASIWNSTQTMLTNVNNRIDSLEASSGSGGVTGVKGSRETSYRTGNVSISCENIGASPAGHEHSNATTSSGGFMSSSDKNKLDGIAEGANKTVVDSSTSTTSTNPLENKKITEIANTLSGRITTLEGNRVVKVEGKGLSTNDFTNDYKSKLDGIASGAQVNSITGIKGNAESSYRTGYVNLTPANIGAATSNHTHDYLPLTGGTLTGGLKATKFSGSLATTEGTGLVTAYIKGDNNTINTYAKIAQIKITRANMDMPILIVYVCRGYTMPVFLNILFSNSNTSADPALASFVFFGYGNAKAYINKSASGTWDVYVKKLVTYDEVEVLWYSAPDKNLKGITVALQNESLATAISGWTEATKVSP